MEEWVSALRMNARIRSPYHLIMLQTAMTRSELRTFIVGGDAISEQRARILLMIPLSGPSGIWGPSALHAAKVALTEINEAGGINGRAVELVVADAEKVRHGLDQLSSLIEEERCEAVIGLHASNFKPDIVQLLEGRIPYIFTPPHEGGELEPGVFTIGELPDQYVLPALDWLSKHHGVERWYLIGSDLVGPRTSNELARRHIEAVGGAVLGVEYPSPREKRFVALLDAIEASEPQCVLLTLLGDEAVHFHRAFARRGLDKNISRLTFATDENMLLAAGENASRNLFAAAGYFASQPNPENREFLESYYKLAGPNPPPPNNLGESCYEGLRFYAALAGAAGSSDVEGLIRIAHAGLTYRGARGEIFHKDNRSAMPAYIATARQGEFAIVEMI